MKAELDARRRPARRPSATSATRPTSSRTSSAVFREYGETGRGRTRHYVHDDREAERYGAAPGTFTDWAPFEDDSDLLFYEGLHGAVANGQVNLAELADLKIGVVPVINLEWIQKIHRDRASRGYSTEAVTDVILRRMHDYVHCICPQFTETDINFQRVPVVDTSNPFIARWIPTADESLVVIRFRNPRGIDFPYLVSMIHDSWMSPGELDRHPRQQARPRDAADPDAADPAAGRPTPGAPEESDHERARRTLSARRRRDA